MLWVDVPGYMEVKRTGYVFVVFLGYMSAGQAQNHSNLDEEFVDWLSSCCVLITD
jgi:hypothetical protein